MPILETLNLPELLKNFNREQTDQSLTGEVKGVFAYEGDAESTLKAQLLKISQESSTKPLEKIYVFVGSEGGFSEVEVELFKKYSLAPITLGTQVLRVETACVALVSVIKYELTK